MKCIEFEHQLESSAQAMSKDAIEHAAECRACAGRFQEEELLSWSLTEIGAHFGQICPAPEIETRVMEAFDRQQMKERHSSSRSRYAVAIAAGLLLMASVSFALLRRQPTSAPQLNKVNVDLSAAVAAWETDKGIAQGDQKAKPRERRVRPAIKAATTEIAKSEAPTEIATDFIRINYASPIEPGAQIVRVQLPRSAMTQFGLPVNMDRADQPVKADVIMGIDGIAQAIRFVQ
jgi:hypothetical protein